MFHFSFSRREAGEELTKQIAGAAKSQEARLGSPSTFGITLHS
jgi:hypothetical protein